MKAWILTASLALAGTAPLKPLPISQLEAYQKEACTFVHPWAAWCGQCVQELPGLMPLFEKWKGVRVVVVDTGTEFAQANFSKKWNVLSASKLGTFLKPGKVDLKDYEKAIAAGWNGALPFSVLYVKGVKKQEWRGRLDFRHVSETVEKLCR